MAQGLAVTPLTKSLLRPIIALNAWTFVMGLWMLRVRRAASIKHGVKTSPQFTREYLYSKIPSEAQWPGDNYNHLLEQPTQYYAIVTALILLQDGSTVTVGLAWAYVGARIVHSIIQAKYNNVRWRARAFLVGTVVLSTLTARAMMLLI